MNKINGNTRNLKMDEEIKKRLKNHEERIKKLEKEKDVKIQKIEKRERGKSLREFFLEFNIKSDLDKTLFIMYAYEKLKGIIEFSTKEIKGGFQEIREKVPKNVADKFQRLHKLGYISPSSKKDKQDLWKLTDSGERYIKDLKKK